MPDLVIESFLQKRKEDWLEKSIKLTMDEGEIRALRTKADEYFSLENWLPKAANRACSRAMTTHPSKFSHPNTGIGKDNHKNFTYVTPVISKLERTADGFLRTGNAVSQIDSVGNAGELDVEAFLNLKMGDGDPLLRHLERDSDLAKSLLNIRSECYEDLKAGLMAMVNNRSLEFVTSSKIKQIYFPVNEKGYHLLSVLSNSGLVYELRERIDDLRFSEKQKALRELKRNNQFSEEGFSEIYEITTIGYGGNNPQNISVLNSRYTGKARLLMSVPPQLERRDVQFPGKNFFINSIRFYDIFEPLQKLHSIFKTGLDSVIPRLNLENSRDYRIEEILDQIIECMSGVRAIAASQYRKETSTLPQYQKIWLCNEYQEERLEQQEWLDELCEDISNWILLAYKTIIKKAVILGPAEREYIKKMVVTNRDALR